MSITQMATRFLSLAALFCFTSCAIHVDLPSSFLQIEEGAAVYKATSADNAIFWIERFDLPDTGGELAFWTDALKNDFVENRGYTLLEEEATTTKSGESGTQLLFETTTQGRGYRYLVAMFVVKPSFFAGPFSGPYLYAARFTAEKAVFEKHAESVKAAVRTLGF